MRMISRNDDQVSLFCTSIQIGLVIATIRLLQFKRERRLMRMRNAELSGCARELRAHSFIVEWINECNAAYEEAYNVEHAIT